MTGGQVGSSKVRLPAQKKVNIEMKKDKIEILGTQLFKKGRDATATSDTILITNDDLNQTDQNAISQSIIITDDDLDLNTKEPKNIVIHHRDIARNPFQWIQGVLKDFNEDSRWWGNGESAHAKKKEYEKIEKERNDVEILFDEIVFQEDTPQNWKDLTEYDLGEIEIKLINEALDLKNEAEIEITEIDLAAPSVIQSHTEQERRNKKYWEIYIKEQQELFTAQVNAIDSIYQGKIIQTPIQMDAHHKQEHRGQQGIWSCVVASTLNAFYALQVAAPSDNETTIIQAIGGRSAFSENGYLPMSKIYDFIKNKGLIITNSGNIIELMQTLECGGVGLIAYGGHARLISGAETIKEQIMLRVNDPLDDKVSLIPIRELLEKINQTKNFYNLFLIEKMLDIKIEE